MCGIAGIMELHPANKEGLGKVCRDMTDSLHHRGPDDSDVWWDDTAIVAFGHRRLSILDLSPLGRQPMSSPCGRYVIAYNGEVYNFYKLRVELASLGHSFKGESDTEVILAAISQWGLEPALRRFVGMFAFALWDCHSRTLFLVRDRLGIKPLYYGWAGKTFVFGSELKALCGHPGFEREVDRNALSLFFRHNYVPAPWTIYRSAHKLQPGQVLTLTAGSDKPEMSEYWSALDAWNNGKQDLFVGSMSDAADKLESLLTEAVSMRMVADVPLGALLSGGIDSSVVVALMQKERSRPVKTFSIGFHEQEYNEAQHAKAVADHLGTDHTELYLTANDMLSVIPAMPKYWDEPFSDSSQIPTYCLSHLTREHVTVALSGDGGDELFAGYQRYFWMDKWASLDRIPLAVRRVLASLVKAIPPKLYGMLGAFGYKVQWRLDMLTIDNFRDFYIYFLSHDKNPSQLVIGGEEPSSSMTKSYDFQFDDCVNKMTFWDTVAYLPDDILVKTDRASMAASLELRVPILDHRVVEFAASLPMDMKVSKGVGKQVLREVLYRHVPRNIVDRPKMGFGVPVQEWLQTDLKEWCCDMLDSSRIRQQGYLDVSLVEQMLNRFMKGEVMWSQQLWNILMFQSWLEEWE